MKYILILILTLFALLSASPEAGTYNRPSVTYLRKPLIRGTATPLSADQKSIIVSGLHETVNLARFDTNWVPEDAVARCFSRFSLSEDDLRNDQELYLREFGNCLEDRVVDPLTRELRRRREERALKIRTEQQKNSFVHDKAKEPGYTIRELEMVESCAYIFAPMVNSFKDTLVIDTAVTITTQIFSDTVDVKVDTINFSENSSLSLPEVSAEPDISLQRLPGDSLIYQISTYTIVHDTLIHRDTTITEKQKTSLGVAIVWWKMIPGDSVVVLEQFEPLTYYNQKVINARSRYTVNGKYVDPGTYATWLIAEEAGDWFKHQIRDFEEFRLTTQITFRERSKVGFSFEGEKILVDDKFQLIRQTENDSGEIESKEFGWILVTGIPNKSRTHYEALSIGGEAHLGMVIREKPMGHGEIALIYQNYPMQVKNSDPMLTGFSVGHISGPRLEVSGNIGRKLRISQLFLVIGGGVTAGDAHGSILNNGGETVHSLYSTVGGHYDISLKKRFYMKRFTLGIQAGGGYEHRRFLLESSRDPQSGLIPSAKLKNSGGVAFAQAFMGVAITPSFSLETSAGYRQSADSRLKYYSDNNDDRNLEERMLTQGQADGTGFSWGVGITVQPFVRLGR